MRFRAKESDSLKKSRFHKDVFSHHIARAGRTKACTKVPEYACAKEQVEFLWHYIMPTSRKGLKSFYYVDKVL
jgi:hypothetical protein